MVFDFHGSTAATASIVLLPTGAATQIGTVIILDGNEPDPDPFGVRAMIRAWEEEVECDRLRARYRAIPASHQLRASGERLEKQARRGAPPRPAAWPVALRAFG
jgi:hypothetical protein